MDKTPEKSGWDIEKIVKDIEWTFKSHAVASNIHIKPVAEMLLKDPEKGLDLVVRTYNNALDDAYTDDVTGENYRGLVEAMAGGPFEHIPRETSNAVGAVYPFLPRKIKNKALNTLFQIYDDGFNSGQVNGRRGAGITNAIREPLLLSDIQIARWLYWPGLDKENQRLLSKYNLFCDFKAENICKNGRFNPETVLSDFIVGYSLLKSDMNNGWGEEYIQVAEPEFLDRTLKGIVGVRFGFVHSFLNYIIENPDLAAKHLGKDQETIMTHIKNSWAGRRNKLRELLPEQVQERVDFYIEEKDWANYYDFDGYESRPDIRFNLIKIFFKE